MSKVSLLIPIIVISCLVLRCNWSMIGSNRTYKVDKVDVSYVIIEKYSRGDYKPILEKKIDNQKTINELVSYLNDNKPVFTKFPINYGIIISYNNENKDTLMTNGAFLKGPKGTFKMSENLDGYLDQLVNNKK